MPVNLGQRLDPNALDLFHSVAAEPPARLGHLAKELGLTVKLSTLPPRISGQIKRLNDGSYEIKINRHESKERQRFTLAHEIGHYLLHKKLIGDGLTDDILLRSRLSNALEVEANQFAAQLLMPRDQIHKLLNVYDANNKEDLEKMAGHLQVSVPALKNRLGID